MKRVRDAASTQPRFDDKVALLAARQQGVFSRVQAVDLGATRGMIEHRSRSGRWDRVAADVFRLAGSPHSWFQDLTVACLAWGPDSAVSHLAAAGVRDLAIRDTRVVELTIPRGRRRAGPGIVHRHALSTVDVGMVAGMPVTTAARTLIDIASVLPYEELEEATDDALRRGMVSIPFLRRRLAVIGRPGRPGIGAMRRLLEARDPSIAVPESVFERRLLRLLERARLPVPPLQHPIRVGNRLVAVADFAFPDAKLAVEADGYRWHSGRARWDHDRTRGNRLTLLGWRVIHVTWTDFVRRPDETIDVIRKALRADPPGAEDLV